ncbi:MAG: cell envelope integrity protein TolA [Woeseiaceae bacterium]|nr:cell envelope integrity protein TolA [Woeseiaceae bacterium]
MIRDKYNIIPMFLAVVVHVLIFGALFVAIDFSRPAYPAVPLAISATLVTEAELPPPAAAEPEPEPEPEPQDDEAERLRQEQEKRQADLRAEQERIRLEQEADRKRREAEEAERRRQRELEVERLRAEAERKRQEDLERQRRENERLRREAEEAEMERRRLAELEAEEMRLAALDADDRALWAYAIQRQITRNFIKPASAPEGLECIVNVKQLPGGQVVDVSIGRCNGDEAVRRAIMAAVNKASPLPSPDNPAIFERDLTLIFRPEQ